MRGRLKSETSAGVDGAGRATELRRAGEPESDEVAPAGVMRRAGFGGAGRTSESDRAGEAESDEVAPAGVMRRAGFGGPGRAAESDRAGEAESDEVAPAGVMRQAGFGGPGRTSEANRTRESAVDEVVSDGVVMRRAGFGGPGRTSESDRAREPQSDEVVSDGVVMRRLGLGRLRWLPDTLYGRLLLIMVVAIGVPVAIAIAIAPDDHRISLLGALCLLLPPVAIGIYFAARIVSKPLAQLANEADALGRGAECEPHDPTGPRELRTLSMAFDLAQSRVQTYVANRSRALAAVSHDLKAPLTRMRLRVATLSDDDAREKLERDVEELATLVQSAISMLMDLEDAEAVESIDVNALLARLQSEYAEMGRSVAVMGRARRPYLGRLQSLRRCFTNLIDNAVKFGESASVTLEDGHALRVKVADRGPGIAPEEIEKVFQPFYRARSPVTRSVEGTGLGLGIARDIVLGHGGELTLRNREVRGLEAEVVLPRG